MRFLITNQYIKDFSGSEINAFQICCALKQLGHDADIGTFIYGNPMSEIVKSSKINIINLLSNGTSKLDYDIIWAHHSPCLSQLLFKHEITDCKILFSSLSTIVPLESPPIYINDIDLFLSYSPVNTEVLTKNGVPREKIHYFPNCAPKRYFNFPRKILPESPERIAIISNHPPHEIRNFANIALLRYKTVDFIGINDNPKFVDENLLSQYDLIITIGKTMQYCFALGLPVYCYDCFGGPGYINKNNWLIAKNNNFSGNGFNIFLTGKELFEDIFTNYKDAKRNLSNLFALSQDQFCLEKNINQVLNLLDSIKLTNIDNFREENSLAERINESTENTRFSKTAGIFFPLGQCFQC